MDNYPLSLSTWDERELKAIEEVVKKDRYTMGDKVSEFESQFSEYQDCTYSVMVNSGSSANLLAVAALFFVKDSPLKPGDEVIVPALSWATTYYPLQQYGLKLKFVDIDLETLNMDYGQLEEAISEKTRLIFSVNILGNSNNFDEIFRIIGERNIFLLEDNCESLGARFKGKRSGTFGVMGTYSSFFSHHISTMEGGVVTTDNVELHHILLSLRCHGWTRQLPQFNKLTGEKSSNNFEESFKFVLPGYNLRPLEMSGAVGVEQLKKLPFLVEQRRKNAEYFQKKFKSFSSVLLQKEIGESSWFAFSMIFENEALRNKVVKHYQKSRVECRPVIAGNFTKNEVIKFFDYTIQGELSNTDRVDQSGLYIGNHHVDMSHYIDYLYKVTQEGLDL